jgi:hypothetical protein
MFKESAVGPISNNRCPVAHTCEYHREMWVDVHDQMLQSNQKPDGLHQEIIRVAHDCGPRHYPRTRGHITVLFLARQLAFWSARGNIAVGGCAPR